MKNNQDKILDFIRQYFKEHCYAPSMEEIMQGTGYRSKQSVYNHVHSLLRNGLIEADYTSRRNADYSKRIMPRAFRPAGMKVVFKEEECSVDLSNGYSDMIPVSADC